MLPDNLGYLFDTALRLSPAHTAVFQGETSLTFAELDARVNRMANALAGLGVGAGDRVALMFGNDWRFLEAVFGPMRLGAVAVPLNIRMGDDALRYVVRRGSRRDHPGQQAGPKRQGDPKRVHGRLGSSGG